MILRLGVSIHAGEVRALLVQRGELRWRASLACDFTPATGAEVVASLLASLPKRFGPRRATVAIGPAWCQVKQIEGLPQVTELALLTRLLRENSASLFLRGANRLAVSNVVRFPDGTYWAAAFDQDVALAVIESLAKRRFANARVVPSVSAMAMALPAGTHLWRDGDDVMELTVDENGLLRRVRRAGLPCHPERSEGSALVPSAPPTLSGALATLGDDAWAGAAAFGAAVAGNGAPFAWRPPTDPKRVARAMRVRTAAGVALTAGAAVAALAAPGARAAQTVREGSAELHAHRATQTEVARAQGELRRLAATLDRVEQFREQRGKTTVLVGAISQALPESTALVSLRIDSLEGSFVALAPHAADILPQLTSVTELLQPRIIGSLTKEMVGAAQLERATLRFKRPAPPKPPASPAGRR